MSWGKGKKKQEEKRRADERKEMGYLTFCKYKQTHRQNQIIR